MNVADAPGLYDPQKHVAEHARSGWLRRRDTLRERQRRLSDELEQVNRELNSMGASDG